MKCDVRKKDNDNCKMTRDCMHVIRPNVCPCIVMNNKRIISDILVIVTHFLSAANVMYCILCFYIIIDLLQDFNAVYVFIH